MTSAVVGTKMTTRATSSSSRVSRGALTIVNSGAGPKRVRPTRARTNARRDGWDARARGWRAVVVVVHGDRAREGRRARGDDDAERWMRGNKFFLKSRGVLGVDARGVTSTGGVDDGSIARSRPAPRIRARGGEG